MNRSPLTFALPLAALLLAACAQDDMTDGPAGVAGQGATVDVVPDGKADDYLSTNGREYDIHGTDRFELPRAADESDADYLLRAAAHAEKRFVAITYFLNSYVTSKGSHDTNHGYGGFRTTVRQRSIAADDVWVGDDGLVSVKFGTEVAGPSQLVRELNAERVGDDLYRFDLALPKMTIEEVEGGRIASKYSNFDPKTLSADALTTMSLDLTSSAESVDAFPRYREMMADGVFDVAIVVGGDYNENRWDRRTARAIYDSLTQDRKLTSPVARFEDLTLESGPFTGSLETVAGTVRIEVHMVHPDMAADAPQRLVEAFKAHAATRDVVIYDGHAGYDAGYSGVVVTYQPRTALSADAFKDLELPQKPQLFVFNGCKTYSVYPDALYANPNKTAANLDIISTVNFSWLLEMTRVTGDLLGSLTAVGATDGLHEAHSFARILADLNRDKSWDVIYGVHGLDDNPHASPWGDPSLLCTACGHHADCAGADSLCVSGVCGMACTADDGCPDSYSCRAVAYAGVITDHQCVKTTRRCE